jgi:hypothetical protein
MHCTERIDGRSAISKKRKQSSRGINSFWLNDTPDSQQLFTGAYIITPQIGSEIAGKDPLSLVPNLTPLQIQILLLDIFKRYLYCCYLYQVCVGIPMDFFVCFEEQENCNEDFQSCGPCDRH